MACAFCLTGTMGLTRNLTAAEIVGQLLAANTLLLEGERVTHIVFMGMGEPLANYAALVQSLRVLTDAKLGLGYSPRRITVSTVGLVSGIEKLAREDLKVNLAISLHAASDEVRSRLMPVNRAWNLEALMRAAHSVKGAARIVGLEEAVQVAHVMEDCFVAAQDNISFPALIAVLFGSAVLVSAAGSGVTLRRFLKV